MSIYTSFNTFRDGGTILFLGRPSQCLITLSIRKYFLYLIWTPPCATWSYFLLSIICYQRQEANPHFTTIFFQVAVESNNPLRFLSFRLNTPHFLNCFSSDLCSRPFTSSTVQAPQCLSYCEGSRPGYRNQGLACAEFRGTITALVLATLLLIPLDAIGLLG